jgi:hypothetical protein
MKFLLDDLQCSTFLPSIIIQNPGNKDKHIKAKINKAAYTALFYIFSIFATNNSTVPSSRIACPTTRELPLQASSLLLGGAVRRIVILSSYIPPDFKAFSALSSVYAVTSGICGRSSFGAAETCIETKPP